MRLNTGRLLSLLRRRKFVAALVLVGAAVLAQVLDGQGPGGLFQPPQSGALDVEGRAKLVDGDSLFINGREVRMVGIDAPEGKQFCTLNGKRWACGEASRRTLQGMAGSGQIRCEGEKEDRHGRLLGTCFKGELNLNREMVARGYAVAYGRYKSEERAAREAKKGLWASEFQRPKAWRRDNGGGS